MKRWLLHIWMIGVLGMLTASCSQEADGLDLDTDGKVQVMFTIALDNPSAGSRATWGDNYDNNADNNYDSAIGDAFDNYINPNQFTVELTLGGKKYEVQNIAHWQTDDNVYEFVGEVGVDITSTTEYEDAKIMVFANMSPATTLGSEIFTSNYNVDSYGIVQNPNGVQYIPMWGVRTANISLTPGTRTDLTNEDPIYLLRAMAKVEVALTAPEYTLTNVSLNRYNTQGNCLPAGATSVTDTKLLHYDNETPKSFNPNVTNASSSELSFNVDGNHLIFYLPEIENTSNDLVMEVTLERDGSEVTLNYPYLHFQNYATKEAFDVVRNHWYQYNITAIGKSLELIADIKPWSSATKEVNIIVEDFHWLYVKDKVLYMNNVNTIKTAFDSSTDDLTYNITDVRVYNTTTAWNTSVNGGQSVSIAETQKGDITITSDIPNNFVGKEFKVTVSSAISGKSETIQVYQFPPLYLYAHTTGSKVSGSDNQNNKNMYIFKTLIADFTVFPYPDEFDEKTTANGNHDHDAVHAELGRSYTDYMRGNAKLGYPQVSTNYQTIDTEENNKLVSPHFMLASQAGTVSPLYYSEAVDRCKNYTEIDSDTGETYSDWRMPTLAEVYVIDILQNVKLSEVKCILEGEYYWSARQNDPDKNINNYVNSDGSVRFMDSRLPDGNGNQWWYNTYVRCVRDIK